MQIEKRNVGTCILLSIVTCGIYGIIWTVKMLKEAVQVKDPNDPGTTEIILGILLAPVGYYMAEKKYTEGSQARGLQHEDRSTLYLILGFVGLGIVNMIMMQGDLNKTADMLAFGGAQPQYQQPAYQQPQYQQPAYQQPQYQDPAYQQPQYQDPAYQQPQYQDPAYQQPQYQDPAYQQPQYQDPAYQQPQEPQYQASYNPPTDQNQ